MTHQDETTTTDWSEFENTEPTPLTHRVRVPPFPVDALPEVIADMVNAVAGTTQTDPAMAATSALSTLATCTGGQAYIEVRSDWSEPCNLYTATIAVSGERKSAVQALMTRPLHEAERRLVTESAGIRTRAEQSKQIAVKRADHLRTIAARAKVQDIEATREAAIEAAAEADAIVVPPAPRILADDATPEAATSLIADHGAIGIISAEGGIFDIMAGRYSPSSTPNMEIWLKGHSGDPHRVDRKGRPPEYIPRPALTLGLMIQPAVVSTLAANNQFRGRGLLARVVFTHPVSKLGSRLIPPPTVPPEVKEAYETAVKELAIGMRRLTGDPPVLKLTDAAAQELQDIEIAVEPTLAGNGELASLADWGSKYVGGVVARIAGNIHLSIHGGQEGPQLPVDVETIKSARRIGEYFKAATINVFAEMSTDVVMSDAIYLLERIRAMGLDEVSERDVRVSSSRSRFPSNLELRAVLALLVDHGYLWALSKPKPDPGSKPTGGRPSSRRYKVHPSVIKPTESHQPSPPSPDHVTPSGGKTTKEERPPFVSLRSVSVAASSTPLPASPPFVACVTNSGPFPENTQDRIKAVITSRLLKVGQEQRYQLRRATKSKDRAVFDVYFDSLTESGYLVSVNGDGTFWRLSQHVTEATKGGNAGQEGEEAVTETKHKDTKGGQKETTQ